ncbi:MAG: hypothetical protein ACLPWS_17350 [Rhodomicrobium sp.]
MPAPVTIPDTARAPFRDDVVRNYSTVLGINTGMDNGRVEGAKSGSHRQACKVRGRRPQNDITSFLLTMEPIMAKGQKRSSREPKKPKAKKPNPAAPSSSFLKEKPIAGPGAKK